jgi:hypothetical protein
MAEMSSYPQLFTSPKGGVQTIVRCRLGTKHHEHHKLIIKWKRWWEKDIITALGAGKSAGSFGFGIFSISK